MVIREKGLSPTLQVGLLAAGVLVFRRHAEVDGDTLFHGGVPVPKGGIQLILAGLLTGFQKSSKLGGSWFRGGGAPGIVCPRSLATQNTRLS